MNVTNRTQTGTAEEGPREPQRVGPPGPDAGRIRQWRAHLERRFTFVQHRSSTLASSVWRGVEVRTGRDVAIKLLNDSGPDSRNAFVAEALLLSELEHPGIVRYIAHGELPDGGAYLVTEWLDGEDLSGPLRRGRLSPSEALTLLVRAANVLAAAHTRGIVHLDIKPSNLFLVGGDLTDIRLLDFGIARLLRSVSSDSDEVLVQGTPGYMAPEQVLGEPLSAATDVFALGCLAFHCVTGRLIFEGDGIELMTQTVQDAPPRARTLAADVPPAFDALIATMLSADPSARPANATALLASVAAMPADVLDGLAASARGLLIPRGLTAAERVPVTVVLVRRPPGAEEEETDTEWAVRASCFEALSDGTWLALPRGNATALDQAHHAARLALDVVAHWPSASVAVTGGRTVDDAGASRLHELVAEAASLLSAAPAGRILLDESSATLVSGAFRVTRDGSKAAVLRGGEGEGAPSGSMRAGAGAACVGREQELTRLAATARESFGIPAARAILVTGPAGIGKSQLFREFLGRMHRAGVRPSVWSSYGDSMSASSAMRLVSALFESRAHTTGGGDASVFARLARARDASSNEVRNAGEAGSVDELHRALCDAALEELDRGPLVLQLEDVHWADLGSLRAIDFLLAQLADRRLLVFATARPEVRDLYPDLWQRRAVVEVRLGELHERDAERYVSMRLGGVPPAVRTRIVQRARGNAFLLEELIRAQEEGRGDEMPEPALGVVQSRLRVLDPDARRLLRAASIFGESFTFAGITRLLGDESAAGDVERWLELLCAREVVRRREDGPGGKGSFAFAHALVRDAAYDLLTDSDRSLGHRLAAQWLEGAGRGDPVVTAQHYERARDSAGAGRCYLRAAVEAFEIGDFTATVRTAEQALALELPQYDRGHAQAIAAHAYRLVGDVEASRRLSAEALRALPPNTPLWRQAARTAMMAGASKARHRDS